jgi:hypothetical protein
MKNIHVIPTDKPRKYKGGKVSTFTAVSSMMPTESVYNIYITNDEEIKEGDWVYNIVSKTKFKAPKQLIDLINDSNVTLTANKKIILTTDQDLIKDGVQAIDDEFLEWFFKNPSCESVEVESMVNMIQFTPREFIYKIIIPKEELKTSEEWQKQFSNTKVLDPDGWDRKNYKYSWFEEKITLAEYNTRLYGSTVYSIIPKEQQKKHIIDMMEKDQELGLYDIFNDEKRQGVKDLIDTHKQYFYCSDRLELDENERCVTQCDHCAGKHKQRLEKYSERFDTDKYEIGNPDTWGQRIIDKHKQDDENYLDSFGVTKTQFEVYRNFNKQETLEEAVNAFKKTDVYINEIKQKQERSYSEEDLFKILLDFVAFPHEHMEPRGSIIERYLKELKNK